MDESGCSSGTLDFYSQSLPYRNLFPWGPMLLDSVLLGILSESLRETAPRNAR